MTHTVGAPRERVWAALSNAGRLACWWCPSGAPLQAASLRFQPGGRFHYAARLPDGRPFWGRIVYRDIAAPARIVFVDSFADAQGKVSRHPLNAHWPRYVHHTLALTERAGGTELHLVSRPVHATESEMHAFEQGQACLHRGFADAWARLDAHLAVAA